MLPPNPIAMTQLKWSVIKLKYLENNMEFTEKMKEQERKELLESCKLAQQYLSDFPKIVISAAIGGIVLAIILLIFIGV